jgi:hypothetical protein
MRVTVSREESEETKRVVRVPPRHDARQIAGLSLIPPRRGARFRPGRTSKIAFAAPKH